ncbi:hypothetical protein C8R43DRAFT_1139627 [Mycena crocata]|nr:hypothetical protein C8R43DRAFT_1139627 [Mycena crocata]
MRVATKRRRITATDFLDIAAVDADREEDSDGDGDDPEDDFIDRRLRIEEDEACRPLEYSPIDDMQGVDLERLADDIRRRHRRAPAAAASQSDSEQDVFSWLHSPEACHLGSRAHLFRVRVKVGYEWDVVHTMLMMALSAAAVSSEVFSVTAFPSVPGSVYVEALSLPFVLRLCERVAFVQRQYPPCIVPATEYNDLCRVRSAPPVPIDSWVRYISRAGYGEYCGDLAWVHEYDPESLTYTLLVVPRASAPCSVRGDDHPVPEVRAAAPTGWAAKKANKKRGRFEHRRRSPPQLRIPPERVASSTDIYEHRGSSYVGGLLLLDGVSPRHITNDRVWPSPEELAMWTSSPLYVLASGTLPTPLGERLSRCIWQQTSISRFTSMLQRGVDVRVLEGAHRDSVGRVVDIDQAADFVEIQLLAFDAPPDTVRLPSSSIMVHYRVGDVVELRDGRHAGVRGTVVTVDWDLLRVCVLERERADHDASASVRPHREQDEQGRVDFEYDSCVQAEKPELCLREWDLPMASIHFLSPVYSQARVVCEILPEPGPKLLDDAYDAHSVAKSHSEMGAPAVVLPPSVRDSYASLEVRIVKGKNDYRGLFATVRGTDSDGEFVTLAIEGRAQAHLVRVNTAHVRERHTNRKLAEYVALTPADKQRIRRECDQLRASQLLCPPDASELPLSAMPSAVDAWPELALFAGEDLPVVAVDSPFVAAALDRVSDRWLLQKELVGKTFDVVVDSPHWRGMYNSAIGVIHDMPQIKRGKQGRVEVTVGKTLATKRRFPITAIHPLWTNEFEEMPGSPISIPREAAQSVLDVVGMYVLIIGPDTDGLRAYVGETGYVVAGGNVRVTSGIRCFPLHSVCRSDPIPRG